MAVFVFIRSGKDPASARPVAASDNPTVAAAALQAMLAECESGKDSRAALEALGVPTHPHEIR